MTLLSLVRFSRHGASAAAGLALVLLLGPFEVQAQWDKAVHVAGFYAFTLMGLVCFPWNRQGEVLFGMVALAFGSELAQLASGRTFSMLDAGANATGAFVAAAPIYVARFRQLAQRDPSATLAQLVAQDRRRPASFLPAGRRGGRG